MARTLGIHLQPDGWSYALLDGNARKWSIRKHGRGGLDPSSGDPATALATALNRGLKGVGKVERVVLALPSVDTVLRELSLPFNDRDKIHQVLKFEVESELYHLDVDDVVCDYIELADDRATASLMVAAVPKTQIRTSLEVAAKAGRDPEKLELDLGAMCAAISTHDMGEAAEGEAHAYLLVGSFTSLLVVRGTDGIKAARTIHLGWRELGRGLLEGELTPEAELNEEPIEVEESDDDTSSPPLLFGADPELPLHIDFETIMAEVEPETLSAFHRRLCAEVRRGLAAISGVNVAQLHLLGVAVPGIDQALSARLGMDVAPLVLGTEEVDSIALGAALRGVGIKVSLMDFRQEEFRQASSLERVEGAITLMLVGLIAFFLVDGVVLLQKKRTLMQDTDLLFGRAAQYVQQLNEELPEDPPDSWHVKTSFSGIAIEDLQRISSLKGRVNKAKVKLDEMVGEAGVELPSSCLNAWRLVTDVLSAELGTYEGRWMLESIDFNSIDARKNNHPSHVAATLELTIFGENLSALHAFESLQGAFNRQVWIIDQAEAPQGFKNQNEAIPGAGTGTIKVKIDTVKSRRAKA